MVSQSRSQRGKKTEVNSEPTPLQAGGYAGGGIGARASKAHHYQNLFNKIEVGTKEYLANSKGRKAKETRAADAALVKAGTMTQQDFNNIHGEQTKE